MGVDWGSVGGHLIVGLKDFSVFLFVKSRVLRLLKNFPYLVGIHNQSEDIILNANESIFKEKTLHFSKLIHSINTQGRRKV